MSDGIDLVALQNLVEGSGVRYRQNNVSWIFDCPRCQKRDKLFLRKRDGAFICWFCATTENYKGRAEFALRDLLSVPYQQIHEILYGVKARWFSTARIDPPQWDGDWGEEFVLESAPEVARFPLDFYPIEDSRAARGAAYLAGRGVPTEVAADYGVRYCPSVQRVVFPVVVDGKLWGWQGRLIVPDEVHIDGVTYRTPKVLTSSGCDREHCVMFQDRLQGKDYALAAEGPISAQKAHTVGGNVALMGKIVSDGQLQMFRAKGIKRMYWALDLDALGELRELCRKTHSWWENFIVRPDPGGDLGDMTYEAVEKAVDNAEQINASRLLVPVWRRR